jgi:glycosyltransferase involved in cell wall biosynthesis
MPRVTVVCPTYNRGPALTATLDSVRAQSVRDWELVVVSDASDDGTDELVRRAAREDPRIRMLRCEQRHGHPSGPRNAALAEARGEIVAYVDHDDVWREDHLAVLLPLFDEGAELAATGHESRDGQGRLTAASEPLELCWHPEMQILAPLFEPSRAAHLRGLPERVGGWRTGVGLEDWDLWVRLTDAGARFRTVRDRTAVLLDDTGTRRYRTPRPHRMPLAAFDDPRSAHAVLRALNDPHHDEAFRAACSHDVGTWLQRLSATPEFTVPHGWTDEFGPAVERMVQAMKPLWPDLVVVPERSRRYVLAQRLWCSSATHAERVTELARHVYGHQFALLDELVAVLGGM